MDEKDGNCAPSLDRPRDTSGRGSDWMLLVALALTLAGCSRAAEVERATESSSGAVTIVFSEFSTAPSIGRGEGSPVPGSEDFGALRIFLEGVRARTEQLAPGLAVTFSRSAGAAPVSDVATHVRQAVYVAGGSLNGTWGFVYNSVPFGPSFPEMISFLNEGGGVQLVNQIYADRGIDVVAFPVVGSPAQMSGYFKRPVGTPECPASGDAQCKADQEGIGLEGLCKAAWTLRYLPPAETVVDRACDEFVGVQRLQFVQAIPGGSDLLRAVQLGDIDGLEFATVLDDFDARKGGLFANPAAPVGSDGRNAGEVGLRFAHYPGWHQPFYLGWMVVNRTEVWERLDPAQRAAIEEAARESVRASFDASRNVQCEYLRRILDTNDGRRQRAGSGEEIPSSSADVILARWRPDDLVRLRSAALEFLESLKGTGAPTNDQADYTRVITALHQYLGYPSIDRMLDSWGEAELLWPGDCAQ